MDHETREQIRWLKNEAEVQSRVKDMPEDEAMALAQSHIAWKIAERLEHGDNH